MSFLRKTDPSRPSLLVLRQSFDEANPADVTMTCSMNPPTRVRRRHNAWLHMIDARGRADKKAHACAIPHRCRSSACGLVPAWSRANSSGHRVRAENVTTSATCADRSPVGARSTPTEPRGASSWLRTSSDRILGWNHRGGIIVYGRGAGRNRTDESRFCRPLPYHLATAPEGSKVAAGLTFLNPLS